MAITFQVKSLKPARLQVDRYRLEILNQLRKEGAFIKKEYERTTATWKRKPKFEILIGLAKSGASVLVGTDNEIYGYVDKGTRPHVIRARRAPLLKFRRGHSAKTRPRQLASYPGGSFGGWVSKKSVNHPGTTPRGFTPMIQKKTAKKFKRNIQGAISRANAKAYG